MLELLIFTTLIGLGSGQIFRYCELLITKEECLHNTFCAWCNTTNIINNTIENEQNCIFKNTCSNTFNDTNCIVSNDTNYRCNFIFLLSNTILIILFVCSTYTISYSFRNILNEDTYKKYGCAITFVVAFAIITPSLYFYLTNSDYFLPYLLALIVISIFFCCCGASSNYKKKRGNYYNYTRLQ